MKKFKIEFKQSATTWTEECDTLGEIEEIFEAVGNPSNAENVQYSIFKNEDFVASGQYPLQCNEPEESDFWFDLEEDQYDAVQSIVESLQEKSLAECEITDSTVSNKVTLKKYDDELLAIIEMQDEETEYHTYEPSKEGVKEAISDIKEWLSIDRIEGLDTSQILNGMSESIETNINFNLEIKG